ncbi:potassium channel family protein [Vibrio sp. PNB23_22_7]
MDITHQPPSFYSKLYLANVLLFSFTYWFFFSGDFGDDSPLGFVGSLYFSVVTITTLGYGDITPNIENTSLLLTIVLQVVFGVITIGLFLNSLSQKLSDKKDDEKRVVEKEIALKHKVKLLTILKPTVVAHLSILAESYKVTSTEAKGMVTIQPKELFGQAYYDQISRQNFLSTQTRYGENVMMFGEFIALENKKFVDGINDFLNKFASGLDIDMVELLVDLINHRYLTHAQQALDTHKMNSQLKAQFGAAIPQTNLLTIEHSSVDIPEKPDSIRDFHSKLLSLISMFDDLLPGDVIEMNIDLRPNVTAPPVGSAIGEVIKFGPAE